MKPLISVIVPVYNVEQFLKKCVDSLLEQTYERVEIILVDDGSEDSSGILCDEMGKKHPNVVVIHQENAGVSAARNNALSAMKGEYVTFVDGDDYVAPNFLETLYSALESTGADISTCGHFRVNLDGSVRRIFSDNSREVRVLTGYESIMNLFYGKVCSASSGSKLYHRDFFKGVEFPPFVMGEDTFVVYQCFSKAKTVAHTMKPLYYYVQHRESVTNKPTNYIKFYDYVRLYDHILEQDKNKGDKAYFKSLANRLIENNFWVYMKLRNTPNQYFEEKKHIEDNIRRYRGYVIFNPKAQLRVRSACLLSYGGMGILNKIYDFIIKTAKIK